MITSALFSDFVNCHFKAYMKVDGQIGQVGTLEQFSTTLDQEYRTLAMRHLVSSCPTHQVVYGPALLGEECRSRPRLILDALCTTADYSWEVHAIECRDSSAFRQNQCIVPIRFSRSVKLSVVDKLLAACDGIILSEIHGIFINKVKLIHGPAFTSRNVSLSTSNGLAQIARDALRFLGELSELCRGKAVVPRMILNRHCDICEFRCHCRQEAEKRDDLSLLRGLPAAEIEMLNERGIFTVTQLAYTFRAKTVARNTRPPKKHSQALQAVAIRDKTIYVRQKPKLPESTVRTCDQAEGLVVFLPRTNLPSLCGI